MTDSGALWACTVIIVCSNHYPGQRKERNAKHFTCTYTLRACPLYFHSLYYLIFLLFNVLVFPTKHENGQGPPFLPNFNSLSTGWLVPASPRARKEGCLFCHGLRFLLSFYSCGVRRAWGPEYYCVCAHAALPSRDKF